MEARGEENALLSEIQGASHFHQQAHRTRSRTRSREHPRFSPALLIIPVAVICRFAIMLPSTTNFTIFQIIACRLWYYINDPGAISPDGTIPEALCSIGGVQQYYAAIMSIQAIISSVISAIACGVASFFSARLGRKPVLIGVFVIAIIAQLSAAVAQYHQGWLSFLFFAMWLACDSFSDPTTTIFITSMYVVDISGAEERTSHLSKIEGWARLGAALSFSLGGSITTFLKSTVVIYLVASCILVILCVYTMIAIPESFPLERREELRRLKFIHSEHSQSLVQKIHSSLAIVLEPLQQLKPTRNPFTGKRNFRLLYCSIHIFIVSLADGYAIVAMILYFTTHYHYTPAQTGFVLTGTNISGVVALTIIVPSVLPFLRKMYRSKQPVALVEEELDGNSAVVTENPDDLEESVSQSSDQIDVYITIGSWAFEALAYIAVGLTTTLPVQIACVFCIGLAAGRTPVLRSLVVNTVDPLTQGEALAAIEMVASIGMVLSPAVMGSILTSTIAYHPQTIFYVHALIVAIGNVPLFLVKDTDRYQTPDETEQGDRDR